MESKHCHEHNHSVKVKLYFWTFYFSNSCNMHLTLWTKRDIQLDQNQLKILLTKIFDMNEISWPNTQTPTVINTILSFAHIKNSRVLIFERILHFFTEWRKRVPEQGRQRSDFVDAETLSILHIIHFIKTDHSVAKDWLKILKVN